MNVPRPRGSDARPDTPDIVEYFLDGVETIVALDHDGIRGLAQEHMAEEIKRPDRNWM
jgi:hypothetical protein